MGGGFQVEGEALTTLLQIRIVLIKDFKLKTKLK